MTVAADVVTRLAYTGSGTTGPFTTPPFLANADIRAVKTLIADGTETTLTLTTDYTLTGAGESSGGALTLTSSLSSSYRLTIINNAVDSQETAYPANDAFPSASHEAALDRRTYVSRRIRDLVDRAIRVADGISTSISTAINTAGKAGYYLRLNAAGDGFELAAGEVNTSSFTQSGTGAVARSVTSKLGEVVSVKDFGAVGDGTTDDTAAIQAAIDHVRSLPNGILFFPPNDVGDYYRTTAPLVTDGPLKIRGSGPNATTILAVGLSAGQYVLDFDCDSADVVEQLEVSGITLRSNNQTPNGMRIKNASYFTLSDVQLYNLNHGIVLTGTRTFSEFFRAVTGVSIAGNTVRFDAYTGGGHHNFADCTFTGDVGFYFTSDSAANNISFVACNWESCVTQSLQIEGSINGLSFVAPRTEGSTGGDFVFYPASGKVIGGLSITGGFFQPNSGASYPITLGGNSGTVRGFLIAGNIFNNTSNHAVRSNGDGESGLITGNKVAGTGGIISAQRAGVVVFGNENSSGKLAEYWGSAAWQVEDGTWTPTDASGAALTLTASGLYTKIGRVVFYQGVVVYPSTADASAAKIAGLPYNPLAGGGSQGRGGVNIGASTEAALGGIHVGGNDQIAWKNADTLADKTNADMSTVEVYFSGHYVV